VNVEGGHGRLLLYAPNVHTGGGFVLLKCLLEVWPAERTLVAWLDERARAQLPLPSGAQVRWVRAAATSRLAAEFALAREARHGDRVLCFHGLPPLLRSCASVHVFQQNRNYLGQVPLSAFAWRTRQRLRFEQAVSRWRRHLVDVYWVQTASMARAMQDWWGHAETAPVRVLPFAPQSPVPATAGAAQWDFVYVADGEAHKNHRRLVEAWVLLAQQGFKPSLALTLSARDAVLNQWVLEQVRVHGLVISNLGQMGHELVWALYGGARALVFPSLGESFGLPLIEAKGLGLPILAAELDFVRDVCEPVQTFDAQSAVSIARAVRRFLQQAEMPRTPVSAGEFLTRLMDGVA